MNKYHNQPTYVNGQRLDSKREAHRYQELLLMQRAGVISDLRRQVPFTLIDTQRDEKGKVLEKACVYKADFVYMQEGRQIVEDSKGKRTDVYIIKRKLMLERFGIRIKET